MTLKAFLVASGLLFLAFVLRYIQAHIADHIRKMNEGRESQLIGANFDAETGSVKSSKP